MGADLARKRRGEKTETGMSEKKLREFAKKPKGKKKRKPRLTVGEALSR